MPKHRHYNCLVITAADETGTRRTYVHVLVSEFVQWFSTAVIACRHVCAGQLAVCAAADTQTYNYRGQIIRETLCVRCVLNLHANDDRHRDLADKLLIPSGGDGMSSASFLSLSSLNVSELSFRRLYCVVIHTLIRSKYLLLSITVVTFKNLGQTDYIVVYD